ncbi:RodZ domain-containing protein [Silvimonas amylolytica]|uniref:Cro/Cl family transcriptional regulator n=1 Tax=Silvimonas amylolytica TaxID=449663 RepID=A0ABQ2PRD9_9NEIS|nr:RodZ domain-containing protein [Silvimonas amylolytica]GGP27547.1 Cro/Cl family transcriptional regulator [Silvimonas amylolytica]
MSEQEQTNAPAYGPGARLKAQREALGLGLDHVAAQLKLSSRQIESIESDHFDQLPGNTFARGFVRNYAKLLQLDPAPLLAQLESLLPRERVQVALPHLVEENNSFSVGNGGGGGGRILGLAGFVLAFCGAVGAIFWYLQQPPSPELNATQVASEPQASEPELAIASAPVASAVADAASAPVVAEASVAQATPAAAKATGVVPANASTVTAQAATPTPVPASAVQSVIGNGELRIVANEDTWVQVIDANGTRLVSNILVAGTDRSLGGVPPYHIKIGNAPNTRVWLRGQTVDLTQYTKTQVANFELK